MLTPNVTTKHASVLTLPLHVLLLNFQKKILITYWHINCNGNWIFKEENGGGGMCWKNWHLFVLVLSDWEDTSYTLFSKLSRTNNMESQLCSNSTLLVFGEECLPVVTSLGIGG